jgi:hypothetical protein
MPAADRQPTFYVTAPLLWPLFLGLRALGLDVDSLASRAELSLSSRTQIEGQQGVPDQVS